MMRHTSFGRGAVHTSRGRPPRWSVSSDHEGSFVFAGGKKIAKLSENRVWVSLDPDWRVISWNNGFKVYRKGVRIYRERFP